MCMCEANAIQKYDEIDNVCAVAHDTDAPQHVGKDVAEVAAEHHTAHGQKEQYIRDDSCIPVWTQQSIGRECILREFRY
jgi:hypothetical protein